MPILTAKHSVFFCILFLAARAYAQPSDIKRLNIENGLSNNSVRCVYQDHNGFMWFGTYDGLNCYDGYHFRIYRNNPRDSNSLLHNYINAIGEDLHYNLIIGTGQGISIYNGLTQQIRPGQYVPNSRKTARPIRYYINDIKTDVKGNVFIATNGGGLMVKSTQNDTAFQVNKKALKNDWPNVGALAIDDAQKLWLIVADVGLFRYDPEQNTVDFVTDKIKSVRCMAADHQGNLWIAAFDGLYKYETRSHALTNLFPNEPAKHFSNTILSMKFDARNKLWMGTEGSGIVIADPVTNKFTSLEADSKKLSGNVIYSIYEDRENRKWIATYKGGVDIIQPHQSPFTVISHDPTDRNSLANNFVSSLYELHDGSLWIGTDGGGISILDRQKKRFTNDNPLLMGLSRNFVASIVQDKAGDIWMASYGGGIDRYTKGKLTHYACINDHNGKENVYAWRLFEDKTGMLWAATYADGLLYYFDRAAGKFKPFNYDRQDFYCLAEDRDGVLWAGSPEGLTRIDKNTRTYTLYRISKPVRAVFQDSRQNIWVGTEGAGLFLFDRKTNKIVTSYTDEEGLCNNAVLNILEDNKGALWLSTFHGLSRFDPQTRAFRNYYKEDGLQSNQYEFNAALKLRSGELAFGGVNGFTIFNPDSLTMNAVMPPLLVTRLMINNAPIAPSNPYVAKSRGDSISRLVIPYKDAMLTMDFTALEYSAPDKICYAYYLEGWDKGWTYAHNSKTATYTRLEEGNYTLHAKATNSEGSWNPREILLEIVVLPPWYRTWLAYTLYAALLAGMIYLFMRYRMHRNRMQYEVKLSAMERAKENELNEKRISLFSRISHEFRTPLTLIMNPIQDLLTGDNSPKTNSDLQGIYRNARRLLSLTDQLLLFQKANTGDDPLMLAQFDYSQLCREVHSYFEQDARLKKIDYHFTCPERLIVCGDRQKLEMVLINLLSNAFKYTPANGKIGFEVADGQELITKISDTGPGIPAAGGDRIFERFYQVSNEQTVSKPGFGIGLFLAKSFVDLHQGHISYISDNGRGTTFTVRLLKSQAFCIEKGVTMTKVPVVAETPYNFMAGGSPSMNQVETADEGEAPGEEILIDDDTTILLVEDNRELRTYVAGLFSKQYRVIEAGSAEEGLIEARESLPDLIITDITMQEMTGMELCRILKNDPAVSHIPIVILTATTSADAKLQAIELGADDYFNKPFDKDLLKARVANLLKNKTALQNYFLNEITFQRNDIRISEEYKEFLERCMAIVERNLGNTEFTVHTLASAIGMSHSKLYKKVKSVSGLTVNAFIRYIRMRKAAELFIHSDMNINETAYEVGFSQVKYFQKQFCKLFGMNPSEYVKKYRKTCSKGYRINKAALTNKL